MSTGDKRTNIYLKKFLPQQQFRDNLQLYIQSLVEEITAAIYPSSGVFGAGSGIITPSLSASKFNISSPTLGTDALGHLVNLDPSQGSEVPFENALGVDYWVGLRFNFLDAADDQTVETNVRTGLFEYTFDQEAVGEVADPDLVVDNGTNLTLRVNTVTESGVNNAGRIVRVYLKPRQSGGSLGALSEATPYEDVTVAFSGGNNQITTSTLLGQTVGNVSTTTSDYRCVLLGPTVKRNTDLSLDPNIILLAKITGTGSGNVITTGDIDQSYRVVLQQLSGIPAASGMNILLEGGGTISHDASIVGKVAWSSAIKVRPLGTSFELTVNASDVTLADDEVAYVDIPDPFASGTVSLQVAARSALALAGNDKFWVFHRNGVFVNVRGGMVLEQGEQRQLEDLVIGNAIFFSNDDRIRYDEATNSYHFDADGGTDNADLVIGSQIFFGALTNNDRLDFAANVIRHVIDNVVQFQVTEFGDSKSTRDSLTQSGTVYSKESDASAVTGVNASLNEVYDQTKARLLLKTTPNNPPDFEVNIAAGRLTLSNTEELGLVGTASTVVDYDGGTVNFSTGVVTGGGANFTPYDPTNPSYFFKYGLALNATDDVVVILPSGEAATAALAPEPMFTGMPIAVITVQDDGTGNSGTIEVISEPNILRFGAAGGGGGGGTPLEIEDEGVSVETDTNLIDFVGNGVEVVSTVAGEVEVRIPGAVFDPSDMIQHLEAAEQNVTLVQQRPSQILDNFSTTHPNVTLSTMQISDGALFISGSNTSGTYEATLEVNNNVTQTQIVLKAALQMMAPRAVAFTPSNTGNPVTMTFAGDQTGIFALNKNIILAKKVQSFGSLVYKFLIDTDNPPWKIAKLNVSDVTYSAPDTTIDVDNPEGYDLSLGVATLDFYDDLVVIPFDYEVFTKGGGAYQGIPGTDPGIDLKDIFALSEIAIPAGDFYTKIAGLTGSAYIHDHGISPSGQYYFGRITEANSGTELNHFFYSKDYQKTFTKFATTKTTNTTGDALSLEEHSGSFRFANKNAVVADNGKCFAIYGTVSTGDFRVNGVYTDLSAGTPVLNDTPATGVNGSFNDAGATAGVIFSLDASNLSFHGIADGNRVDLSYVAVFGVRSDGVSTLADFTSGGSVFGMFHSGTSNTVEPSTLSSLDVFDNGASHRAIATYRLLSTGQLRGSYWDEGSATQTEFTINNAVGCQLLDTKISADGRYYALYRDDTNDFLRLATSTFTGAPSIVDVKISNQDPNGSVGWSTADFHNYMKTVHDKMVINPNDNKHVFFTVEFTAALTKQNLFVEIQDVTNYVGIQVTNRSFGTSAGLNNDAARQLLGQTFTPTNSQVQTIAFITFQNGFITAGETLECDVYATSTSLPTGSPIATSTNSIEASHVVNNSNAQWVHFNFNSLSLTPATQYAAVVRPSYATHATNYISLGQSAGDSLGGEQAVQYNGSVWSSLSANDFCIEVFGEFQSTYDFSRNQTNSPFRLPTDTHESRIALIDDANIKYTFRETPTQTSSYIPVVGHSFEKTIAISGTPGVQSVASDTKVVGYDPNKFEHFMIFTTSLGNTECGQQNTFTGVIDTTRLSEDRSGNGIIWNQQTAVTYAADANFEAGQAGSFNGTTSFIQYTHSDAALPNFQENFPMRVEVEVHPSAVGTNIRQVFGSYNAGTTGWIFGFNASGFLTFSTNDTRFTTASDAVESTDYHKIAVSYDPVTGLATLERAESPPYTTFTEVASYSSQQVHQTTTSTAGLEIGATDAGGARYYAGKIGYIKFARFNRDATIAFATDGFYSQPSMTIKKNFGTTMYVETQEGTNSTTNGTNFNPWGIVSASTEEAARVDSNALYLIYNAGLLLANQGSTQAVTIYAGRQSTEDPSKFLGMIYRGLNN